MVHGRNFAFSLIEEKPQKQKAIVTIGREHIDALYNEALVAQKCKHRHTDFQKEVRRCIISSRTSVQI